MYTEFFGLNEKPFAITPDPRYLYMSARHTDALAHLLYGISESGGFIQLTGEVGTGKTTLIRSVLERLPEKADIALILSPQLTTIEFLETIVQELRCPAPVERTVKAQIDALNVQLMHAHAEGRRVVLIVDEAQTLSPELLEQVRLLTNLETAKQKLLQIILIGQPELRELLDRSEMRQIAQRITGRYHLEPLRKDDTRAYVNHRLRVAGAQSDIFTNSAINALYKHSRGIPRLINVIADRALLAAYAQERRSVDARLVSAAANEVFGIRRRTPWWPVATAAVGVTAVVFGITNLGQRAAACPHARRGAVHERGARADPDRSSTSSTELPRRDTGQSRGGGAAARPATAADPPPATATLPSLLADPKFAVTTDDAIGELLALWGAHYDAARGEPCVQAQEQGLRCLFQRRGTFGELRRVNWPTILSLVTADGADHSVVVSALGYDHVQLAPTAATFELPLAELSFYWFGDHLLLWRPGEAPARDLAPGVDDVGVHWLRATLAKLAGEPAPSDASTLYDDALEQRRARVSTAASAHGRWHRRRSHADRDVGGARPAGHAIAGRGSLTCRSSSMHLRKSEHERQRSTLPGLSQVPLATPPAQLPRWALVVIGVLAAGVLVLGGAWWQSTRAPTETTAAAPTIERSVELPPPAATFTPPRLTPPAPSQSAPARPSVEDDVAPSEPDRARDRRWTARRPPSRRSRPTADQPALPSPAALAAEGVAIPTLRLELHAFSAQPRDRFVFINGRKYVEGDRLAEGPQLVSIEPTGAVLTQYGQRFLLAPE